MYKLIGDKKKTTENIPAVFLGQKLRVLGGILFGFIIS
jgi:hypothetical protein